MADVLMDRLLGVRQRVAERLDRLSERLPGAETAWHSLTPEEYFTLAERAARLDPEFAERYEMAKRQLLAASEVKLWQ